MTRAFHPMLAPLLAIVLALTGQSMTVARTASAATGQMVLCVGANTVTVYVDAEGQPTSAPHICPECAFAGLNADAVDRTVVVLPAGLSLAERTTHRAAHIGDVATAAYKSRAPPATT